MNRYTSLIHNVENEGAFVPFILLGDPSFAISKEIIRTAIHAGADALELGVAFSDPVADGPTVATAHIRALEGGSTVQKCLDLIREIREEFPHIPIGMLIYANVAYAHGLENFYHLFAQAGADSVLIPDIPVREGKPFVAAAQAANISPIFIAPARATYDTLREVTEHSQGYVYTVSRDGVTGTERVSEAAGLSEIISHIHQLGGPPAFVGFGISTPEHVREALAAGARGVITGSALTSIISQYVIRNSAGEWDVEQRDLMLEEIATFVSTMKKATLHTPAEQ